MGLQAFAAEQSLFWDNNRCLYLNNHIFSLYYTFEYNIGMFCFVDCLLFWLCMPKTLGNQHQQDILIEMTRDSLTHNGLFRGKDNDKSSLEKENQVYGRRHGLFSP